MIYTIHTIDEQTFSMVRYAVANSPYTLRGVFGRSLISQEFFGAFTRSINSSSVQIIDFLPQTTYQELILADHLCFLNK